MSNDSRPAEVDLLRRLVPLGGMKQENIRSLARKVRVRSAEQGRVLFQEGGDDKQWFWVVSGTVELWESGKLVGAIRGGTPEAREALAPGAPRRCSARAAGPVEYLAIDAELLDVMITWDQTGTYEVGDLQAHLNAAGEGDWMTTLLRNGAVQRLPAGNLHGLFMLVERVPVKAGDVIIRQGAPGDFFYFLISGKAVVARETPLNRAGIKLAELNPGDGFGEESLLAGTPRSATVTMSTDGVVMRLPRNDFLEQLANPLITRVSHADGDLIVGANGSWIDVRLPADFQRLSLEGAVNIPLYMLRMKLSALDPKRHLVLICDDGRMSAAAAYVLLERGFNVSVLEGGLAAVDSGLRRST